jgi:hypothetical protein
MKNIKERNVKGKLRANYKHRNSRALLEVKKNLNNEINVLKAVITSSDASAQEKAVANNRLSLIANQLNAKIRTDVDASFAKESKKLKHKKNKSISTISIESGEIVQVASLVYIRHKIEEHVRVDGTKSTPDFKFEVEQEFQLALVVDADEKKNAVLLSLIGSTSIEPTWIPIKCIRPIRIDTGDDDSDDDK